MKHNSGKYAVTMRFGFTKRAAREDEVSNVLEDLNAAIVVYESDVSSDEFTRQIARLRNFLNNGANPRKDVVAKAVSLAYSSPRPTHDPECMSRKLEVIKALVECGVPVVHGHFRGSLSARIYDYSNEMLPVIKYLMEQGCKPAGDNLFNARKQGVYKIADLFKEYGATEADARKYEIELLREERESPGWGCV